MPVQGENVTDLSKLRMGEQLHRLLHPFWTPAGKQALGNLIGLGVCTAVSQACAFGMLLVLTQTLTPAAFGAVIFALNMQVYLNAFGRLGLTNIVVRDLTQQPEEADETTMAFLSIVGAASLLTGVLTAVVVAVVPISWDERVVLWCMAAGNVAACLNLNPLYDAAHRQALAAALTLPADLVGLGVIYGLSAAGTLTVPLVGFVLLGKLTLTAGLHAAVFGWAVRSFRRLHDWGRMRRMIRVGRPLMWAGLLCTIPMSGSVVLVRVLSGKEAAAIYGLAFQIVGIELMVVGIMLRILQPHISGTPGLAPRFLRQVVAVVVGTLSVLTVGSLGTGWVLFSQVLRPEYRAGYPILAVLQLFVLCFGMTAAINLYLIRFHMERWLNTVHIVSIVFYLWLVLWTGWNSALEFASSLVLCSLLLLLGCGIGLGMQNRKFNEFSNRG